MRKKGRQELIAQGETPPGDRKVDIGSEYGKLYVPNSIRPDCATSVAQPESVPRPKS